MIIGAHRICKRDESHRTTTSHLRHTRNYSTYTDRDVPITIKASAFSRSASKLLFTFPCKLSPKNVTPGFKTPPQWVSFDNGSGRARFRIRALSGRDAFGGVFTLAANCWHRGTVPSRMDCSMSAALTLVLHLRHVAHCNEPWEYTIFFGETPATCSKPSIFWVYTRRSIPFFCRRARKRCESLGSTRLSPVGKYKFLANL